MLHENQIYSPVFPLNLYIDYLWRMSESNSPEEHMKETLLPDGGTDIIINLGDPYKQHLPQQEIIDRKFFWIAGQRKKPLGIESTGTINLVGIRFKLNGLYPILKIPVDELTEQTIYLDLIWGREAFVLKQSLVT